MDTNLVEVKLSESLKDSNCNENDQWILVYDFVKYALKGRTRKSANNEIVCGNSYMVETLNPYIEREDLEIDITEKIMRSMDKIKNCDFKYQIAYIRTIISNYLITECKKIKRNTVSLYEPLYLSSEGTVVTYEDSIYDEKNVEDRVSAYDIFMKIVDTLNKPSELFSFLTLVLSMGNSEVYEMLNHGTNYAVNSLLKEIQGKIVNLNKDEYLKLKNFLLNMKESDFKLETSDDKIIKNQISNLRNRAKNKLKAVI